ncbi:hypothetical protein J1N35_018926, partial [Gossypium stocksii]
ARCCTQESSSEQLHQGNAYISFVSEELLSNDKEEDEEQIEFVHLDSDKENDDQ